MKTFYTYTIGVLFVALATAWCLHLTFPVYYAIKSTNIKKQQYDIITRSKKHLELVSFSLSDFERIKTGNELIINGEMYDIATIEYTNDSVKCSVLKDTEETELNHRLVYHVQHSRKRAEDSKQTVFWGPVFCPPGTHSLFSFIHIIKPLYLHSPFHFVLNGHTKNIIHPPEMVPVFV